MKCGHEMTSEQGKQKPVFPAVAKARKARLRRLEIRKAKSCLKKEFELGGPSLLPDPECGETMMGSEISFPDCCSSDHDAEMTGKAQIGDNEEPKSSQTLVEVLTSGWVCLIGRRRKMEDAVTVAPGSISAGEYSFFAVYDGHGGDSVANACSRRLHKLLENELQEAKSRTSTENIEWKEVFAACFSKMDDEVRTNDQEAAEEMVGSTAVVVIVGKEEVVVANCGDSRAVLCRCGIPIPLSDDHKVSPTLEPEKTNRSREPYNIAGNGRVCEFQTLNTKMPERPDERERVEAAGGRIINWNGCRVQGVLSTSRSIGDHYLKPYVISEPEVTVTRRTDSDEFLIIASDGLWDVVSNEFACEVLRRCIEGRSKRNTSTELIAADGAAILAELAVAKGSRDNMSIIVVDLQNIKI